MKLLLIFLCVCGFEAISGGISDFRRPTSSLIVDEMARLFQIKCDSKVDEGITYTKYIIEYYNTFFDCQRTVFKKAPHPILEHELFCDHLGNSGYYTCIENWTKGVELCLDESEKYLSRIILDAANSTYNEWCGVNGLISMQLSSDLEKHETCSVSIFMKQLLCSETLSVLTKLKDDQVVNLNKVDVCHDLETIQQCFNDGLKEVCVTDYSSIVNSFLGPIITKECNGTQNEIQN